MAGSFRLGKVFGIDLYVNPGWFLILILLTWSLATSWFARGFPGWSTEQYWITALVSALLLFMGVLVHELAHALVARRHGIRTKGITLFIFGGVAEIEQEPKRPGVEFQIAVAGPIASLLLAGLAYLLAQPFAGTNSVELAVLDYLAISNLVLGLFNLLPGYPLDGGRILRSIVWKVTGNAEKSLRAAAFSGQICGFLFILLGIFIFFTGDFFDGIWAVFIGWFLWSAAQHTAAQQQLKSTLDGVTVQQVMQTQPLTAPANISLHKLVNEYMLPNGLQSLPITQGDYLMGLITLTDIAQVEQERWSVTPVGYVMRMREKLQTTTPEQPLNEVLQTLATQNINQVPVLQGEQLVGMLNRESVVRYLQVRQTLKPRRPEYAA